MADEQKTTVTESVSTTGSSADDLIKAGPTAGGAAGESGTTQPQKTAEEVVSKKDYEELASKLGEQGKELGDYRKFIGDITPLLNVLEKDSTLVQALLDGKIDGNLAKAALEGKITIQDAAAVSVAHDQVKEDLGQKKYDQLKPEEVTKLIEEKIKEGIERITKESEQKINIRLSASDDRKAFESDFEDFVKITPDIAEFMPAIDKWFDENPEQFNIRVAYDAVKGRSLAEKFAKDDADKKALDQKNLAANAAGGYSQNATIVTDQSMIDKLIRPISNPNY